MVDKTTTNETASAAIADADLFRLVQSGASVKGTFAKVKTWIQGWISQYVFPTYVVGNYYVGQLGSTTGNTLLTTVTYFSPIYINQKCTISELGARVSTLSAGGNFQLGIYTNVSNRPGLLLSNTGAISTASAVGIAGALGANQQVGPGVYWVGIQCDNTTAVFTAVSAANPSPLLWVGETAATVLGAGATQNAGYQVNMSYGTWTADLTAASWSVATRSAMVQFKVASVP